MQRRDFLKLCTAGVILPSVIPLDKVFAQTAPNVTANPIKDVLPGEVCSPTSAG